jgi:hypothetical protein
MTTIKLADPGYNRLVFAACGICINGADRADQIKLNEIIDLRLKPGERNASVAETV